MYFHLEKSINDLENQNLWCFQGSFITILNWKNTQDELEKQIQDFLDQVDSHEVEAQLADLELECLHEARLQEQAVFYKNLTLLNYC